MNTIKRTLTSFLVFLAWAAFAQSQSGSISIPLTTPGKTGTLEVSMITGSITVKGYDGKDVQITMTSSKEDEDDDQGQHPGMKRLSVTGGGIEAKESNNTVSVHTSFPSKLSSLQISVPGNFNLKLHTVNDGEITVTGIKGEIEAVNVNGGINLENISGSVSANTVNGDVIVKLNEVTPGAPQAFSTLNGDVDVTVPASCKGNVKLKSDQGDIYTDFDISVSQNQGKVETSREGGVYKVKIDNWIEGAINGGGPQILMKNMNGDLFLRKGK